MVEYLFYGEKIDAQALALKIGKTLEEIDTSWFSAFMSPLQVVDKLVREFGYFDEDMNILKLLEFASHFSDISYVYRRVQDFFHFCSSELGSWRKDHDDSWIQRT